MVNQSNEAKFGTTISVCIAAFSANTINLKGESCTNLAQTIPKVDCQGTDLAEGENSSNHPTDDKNARLSNVGVHDRLQTACMTLEVIYARYQVLKSFSVLKDGSICILADSADLKIKNYAWWLEKW